MATDFPAGLDSFTRYVDDVTKITETTLNNMQEAVEALQVKVGVNEPDSGDIISQTYKLDVLGVGQVVIAWLAYDGNTNTILGSFNINASLTGKNGVGDYRIVFTTVAKNQYQCYQIALDSLGQGQQSYELYAPAGLDLSQGIRIKTFDNGGNSVDTIVYLMLIGSY